MNLAFYRDGKGKKELNGATSVFCIALNIECEYILQFSTQYTIVFGRNKKFIFYLWKMI